METANTAGTAASTVPGVAAGSAGNKSANKARRRSSVAKIRSLGGNREVKTYVLIDHELDSVSSTRTRATIAFSIASATAGFALSAYLAVDLATEADPVKLARWQSHAIWSAVLSALFFACGCYLWWEGRSLLTKIKGEMIHDE